MSENNIILQQLIPAIRQKNGIAILIDIENASMIDFPNVMKEIEKIEGFVITRRAYGDFTSKSLINWRDRCKIYNLSPMQCFQYTANHKNTSDIIIDAMDILHDGLTKTFCIVSSNSDFTSLSTRLRTSGCTVIGFGTKQTISAYQRSCTRFVEIENLPTESISISKLSAESAPFVFEKLLDKD